MANDVFQLQVIGNAANEPVANVLHFERTSGAYGLMATLGDVIAGFQAQLETPYLDCMAQDYSLLGYKCKRINNGGSPTMSVLAGSLPGNIAHNVVDAASGATILAYYDSDPTVKFPLGHVVAGRIFLPAAPATCISDSVIQTSLSTPVNALITALNSGFAHGGQSFNWVIWSKTFSKSFGPFDVSISAKVGIQRRRLLPSF